MSGDFAGQVALVTGASAGIGRAAAVALARRGAHVVATGRRQGGLEETDDLIRAAGGSATLLPLDFVKEGEQLDAVGPSIVERFGRLDILVHAAGVLAKLTPAAHIMPRDWEESLAVNASAAWRLIRTCDPPLRAAPAGRALFLTDARAGAYWGLYAAAKAAAATLAACWAAEVATTPLRVILADPGPVGTRLHAAAFPGADRAALRTPQAVGEAIAALLAAPPDNGARVAI
ncbi:MAG: SDR family NAD(P)-dependent oxidoreductase [Rubritepida sp.]|nr:SDR family NAD(P)-dependent oxidoreductase [Rubritepida sp.]